VLIADEMTRLHRAGGENGAYADEAPAEHFAAAGARRGGTGRGERRTAAQDLDDEIPF
jgi:hypothetical protein